ncbi:DUF928 domain-containing protein [Microcoleus sp. LEGE 07076]|uniref:DUF928 domain-containing protein n=1 Tax=Microcoleus sp. LEGE 07076 TaxID=915322 RepID=UPI001880377A|nr:DUF928 domain-containing protein [Microcoleus sp. LEGE 07076]MBE9185364.1 DUF928 domain-containing protein [Microcoleus sp. LEGE 07076]
MQKNSNFRLNSIAFGAILLIAAFNAGQLASLAQPMPREDPGKPRTQSGGPRFVQPREDIDMQLNRPATPGGTRGGCAIDPQLNPINLTALAPQNKISRTVSDYPTFFFYLPPTRAKLAEFMLQDPSGKEIYKQTLAISNVSGTIGVSIPANKNVPPLEAGKTYRWSFTVICDSQDRSGDMLETGTVLRVELSADIRSQLEKADPRQKSFIYAKNGIWQDALSILAAALQAQPNNPALKTDWESLLDSVNLGKIAQKPIVQTEESQPEP